MKNHYRKVLEDMEKDRIVTIADLPVIKKGYARAYKKGAESFTVTLTDGKPAEFLTAYAKYVIAYFMSLEG